MPPPALRVRLDGVVTVVDAKHVSRHLDTRKEGTVSEAVEQIAYADRILLNKTDLVCASGLLLMQTRIHVGQVGPDACCEGCLQALTPSHNETGFWCVQPPLSSAAHIRAPCRGACTPIALNC